ncbi:MAG: sensor histidine kinase [Actinoallomurus sp.]
MGESLRRRLARWLDPELTAVPITVPAPASEPPPAPPPAARPSHNAWPAVCERFAFQILGHAESLRPALDRLEADEQNEERLRLLYQVDHSLTRMRRAARDLWILAGVEDGDVGGHTSSLVDVIRVAESAIEQYSKVVIGRVVDLAVVPYASEDLASLLAALLDNATSYSPSMVKVSAHLLDSGSVMLRVEDNGIGIPHAHLEILNATLTGPVPEIDERAGKHTGFPVVHRLARKHGVGVRFASRPQGAAGGGTVAMVTIPPDLLCEIPDDEPPIGGRVEPESPAAASGAVPSGVSHANAVASSHLSVARPSPFAEAGQGSRPLAHVEQSGTISDLPRRTRTSLRGAAGPQTRPVEHNRVTDTSVTARSFAEDLNAFTAGERAGRQTATGDDHGPEGEER